MRVLFIVVTLGLFGPSALALAANHVVHQKGRMFASEFTTIKKGQQITFLNDDTVPHNVISVSPGNEFDLGSQPPGSSTDVTFTKPAKASTSAPSTRRMRRRQRVTE